MRQRKQKVSNCWIRGVGTWALLYYPLFFPVLLETPIKNVEREFWTSSYLSSLLHGVKLMIKLSQEPRTKQDSPLWRQSSSPWRGTLWAQRIYAFSSVGNSRKTMALWSLYSISLSRWFWAWGQGRFCPETVQILTPRDPGRAGTDRLQLGGQHSAADTRKMHSSVLLGLESYMYHILPCTMCAFLPKFLREK